MFGTSLVRTLSCAFVLAALAACQRPADTQAGASVPAPPTPAPTINPSDLKDVTASYACEDGSRVDVVRDQVARVTLTDGRVVKIELVENSAPRTFMDNGLTFEVLSAGNAELSDEKNRTLVCKSP